MTTNISNNTPAKLGLPTKGGQVSGFLNQLHNRSDLVFAASMLTMMAFLMVPLPTFMLDFALALSLIFSLLIFMSVLFIQKPLEFSSFPTILLVSTLLRLSLNVASTRLILSEGHHGTQAAGKVIETFGKLIIGGNFVIGAIIFFILIIINFVVITKGSGRIAEVCARFSLDAMPGKQMAIDADLAAGLVNDDEAKKRRRELEQESSFYGSMDGAAKFVRGDAIAGVLITFINILGGIIIGVAQKGLSIGQASATYTLLTVGDGLVTQMPALIVSTAAGLLISKNGSEEKTDRAFVHQLGSNPNVLCICCAIGLMFACLPGLPAIPFLIISGVCGFAAFRAMEKNQRKQEDKITKQNLEEVQKAATTQSRPVSLSGVLPVDPLRLEIGLGLLGLVEGPQGSRIADQLKRLRQQFSQDLGVVLPAVRIFDSLSIGSNQYRICIKETPVAQGQVVPYQLLVLNPKGPQENIELSGEVTIDPAFGVRAMWVDSTLRNKAVGMGYTVIDPITVIATHLSEVIKDNMTDLFSYASMQLLFDELPETYKRLLNEIVPHSLSFPLLQKILQNLIGERVSIRDLPTILEAIAEACGFSKNVVIITEHVRQRLSRSISNSCCDEKKTLSYITLPTSTEKMIMDGLISDGEIKSIQLSPMDITNFLSTLTMALDLLLVRRGEKPVLLVNAGIRPYVRLMIERVRPSLRVLSHNELHPKVTLNNLGNLIDILAA